MRVGLFLINKTALYLIALSKNVQKTHDCPLPQTTAGLVENAPFSETPC